MCILVVDDCDDLRRTYCQGLELMGYHVQQAKNGAEAIERARVESPDVALLDLHMPGMDGLGCLRALKEEHADMEVLIMTGFGTIPSAVEAMRLGAYDYITKPFSMQELDQRLKRAVQARDLRRENVHLRGLLRDKYHCQNLIGKTEPMLRVFKLIRQVSQSRATVLLQGKSGTGKELVARAIHFNSPLASGPMVTVDCGAIAPTVIESELFGHMKGAFTGAYQAKEGLFRVARRGTLFFDEIGELPLEMQAKLLRALQEREVRPVGSERSYAVDVRIIAATNRDLAAAVKEGRFREDLFYRLNVITIEVPPLAAHSEDIPLLLAHFLKKHARHERPIERVHAQALDAMMRYEWPGNVRELENVVERMLTLGSEPVIMLDDLPQHIASLAGSMKKTQDLTFQTKSNQVEPIKLFSNSNFIDAVAGNEFIRLDDESPGLGNSPLAAPMPGAPAARANSPVSIPHQSLDDIEKQAIVATLQATGGDRTASARILGIDKSTLYRKLKRYNMSEENDLESHAEAG